MPLDDQNCIEHYNNIERSGGVKEQKYKGFQVINEYVRLDVNRDGTLIGLKYVIRDREGKKKS